MGDRPDAFDELGPAWRNPVDAPPKRRPGLRMGGGRAVAITVASTCLWIAATDITGCLLLTLCVWLTVPAWLWEVLTPTLGDTVTQSTADFVESRRLELATRVARRERTNGLVLLASVLAVVHGVLETLGHWPSLVHAETFAAWVATVVVLLSIYAIGLRRRREAAAELSRLDALDL